jgi:hypothetical protein
VLACELKLFHEEKSKVLALFRRCLRRWKATHVVSLLLTMLPDPVKASIGADSVAMVGDLLESLAIWPLTERLGWTSAQVEVLTNAARVELQDVGLRLYLPMLVHATFDWLMRYSHPLSVILLGVAEAAVRDVPPRSNASMDNPGIYNGVRVAV